MDTSWSAGSLSASPRWTGPRQLDQPHQHLRLPIPRRLLSPKDFDFLPIASITYEDAPKDMVSSQSAASDTECLVGNANAQPDGVEGKRVVWG
jgi:hypothetical protein